METFKLSKEPIMKTQKGDILIFIRLESEDVVKEKIFVFFEIMSSRLEYIYSPCTVFSWESSEILSSIQFEKNWVRI